MLVGNLLMHKQYKRRWRAVKDLRDVYIRFNQAEAWYDLYGVDQNPGLLGKWLEYLHALNLEQFDSDVWKAMLKANKRRPELTPEGIQRNSQVAFCHQDMKELFVVDGMVCSPHFVTGNKMRFEKVGDLLKFLFLWDEEKRLGWGDKPYRTILRKSFELIERRLGRRRADRWLSEFLHLVRLTHWILPYPSNAAFITATKTSNGQGLKGRMMWFSAVYTHPSIVELPFKSVPSALYKVLWNAQRQILGSGSSGERMLWGTSQLISACRAQGILIHGLEEEREYWVVGKRSVGLKGFQPLWEKGLPPKLKMMKKIRDKSLDELDELMVEFTRIQGEGDESIGNQGVTNNNNEGEVGERSDVRHRRSIREVFMRHIGSNGGRSSQSSENIGTPTASGSGSVFMPSESVD
ncbi:uncharacterized protein BDR25DRAFT_249210 [Lindgomyces ingoldianus]|uniref:Uncharacterized protein n=1 Tax=Lindgomyces ingoldianus TaxID=673940 RepID=A0ACB6Q6G0_9PLEO|nr:uncharacterized protein BDR25DRAFT_249210 [Lindgomyces ingoldianus]KAF2462478.1 hypothetical protein BDR25DRAFT_249210 [Lindgomyces ingoldianus]